MFDLQVAVVYFIRFTPHLLCCRVCADDASVQAHPDLIQRARLQVADAVLPSIISHTAVKHNSSSAAALAGLHDGASQRGPANCGEGGKEGWERNREALNFECLKSLLYCRANGHTLPLQARCARTCACDARAGV